MAYTPTEWESADVVTAVRMNALENAVGDIDMSYTPNVWSDGDILTADKMNALEQAVASGGGGGSSGVITTAQVTLVANAGSGEVALLGGVQGNNEGFAFVYEFDGYGGLKGNAGVLANSSNTFTAVLALDQESSSGYSAWFEVVGNNVQVTGNALYDDGLVGIFGDCTITADPTT